MFARAKCKIIYKMNELQNYRITVISINLFFNVKFLEFCRKHIKTHVKRTRDSHLLRFFLHDSKFEKIRSASPVVGIRIQDKVCFFLNLVLEERDLSSYCTTAQCTVVLQIVLALQ